MTDSVRDRPRRPMWVKVVVVLAVLMILLVGSALLAHAIWAGKEKANADAWIARIKASGEPLEPADLIVPEIPVARNRVALIREAHAKLTELRDERAPLDRLETEHSNEDDWAFTPPLSTYECSLLADRARLVAPVRAITAQLKSRDAAVWEPAPTGQPLILLTVPEWSTIRELANLQADEARVAAHERRFGDALDALEPFPLLADAAAQRGLMIGFLIASGIHGFEADRFLELAPDLDTRDAAVRDRIKAAIARLMDDAPILAIARQGLLGERVAIHDTTQAILSGTFSPTLSGTGSAIQSYALRPMIHRSDARAVVYMTTAIDHLGAADQKTFETDAKRLAELQTEIQASKLDLLAQILLPALDRGFEARYRVLCDRHAAATALAIRLYQQDHAGERPATLDALVPAYLPRMPFDAIDGKPLRYDPKRSIVWSVGDDGVDDGGDATSKRPQWRGPWQRKDAVYFLDRQPRPATQPAQ